MKRIQLKSKDLKDNLAPYNIEISKKDIIERIEDDNYKIILINKQPTFFYYDQTLLPTLQFLQQKPNLLKQITVDMGAIKFIINGADIMRPGITAIEEGIEQEQAIVIIDQQNKKPLAVGIALVSSSDMQQATSGKVIKNIHYVGDALWKFATTK